ILAAWVIATLLFTGPVLAALKQPATIVPMASVYTRALIPGALPLLSFFVFRQTLQAMSITRPILIGIIVGNITNGLLNWILIFGHFGAPAMGVAGSAWATSISRWILLAIVLGSGWRVLVPYVRHWHADSFALAPLLRMLHIGAPIGLHQL